MVKLNIDTNHKMAAAIAMLSTINAVANPDSWGAGQAQIMTTYVCLLLIITEITHLHYKAFPSTGKLDLFYKEQPTWSYVRSCVATF